MSLLISFRFVFKKNKLIYFYFYNLNLIVFEGLVFCIIQLMCQKEIHLIPGPKGSLVEQLVWEKFPLGLISFFVWAQIKQSRLIKCTHRPVGFANFYSKVIPSRN